MSSGSSVPKNWWDFCVSLVPIARVYESVPALDPFPLYDVQIDPGLPAVSIGGWLPRLPENLTPREGEIPERASLHLTFMGLRSLSFSGSGFAGHDCDGNLEMNRHDDGGVAFQYRSATISISGVSDRVVIAGFRVLTKPDPGCVGPRGPGLFAHHNVYNSCLLLLRQKGYTLQAYGNSELRDYPLQLSWRARLSDGTELSAHSPIELLGLAALREHHNPVSDKPYWWRINGSAVYEELVDEWMQRAFPGSTGTTK